MKKIIITLLSSLLFFLPIYLLAADKKEGITHLSQEEFIVKVKDDNTVIIDVRTKNEFSAGHIADAILIPHKALLNDLSLLDPYKDNDIIFYCHSGVRVKRVTDHIKKYAYIDNKQIFHLKGDIRAWKARNRPLIKE